jgi:hypothetical protein
LRPKAARERSATLKSAFVAFVCGCSVLVMKSPDLPVQGRQRSSLRRGESRRRLPSSHHQARSWTVSSDIRGEVSKIAGTGPPKRAGRWPVATAPRFPPVWFPRACFGLSSR